MTVVAAIDGSSTAEESGAYCDVVTILNANWRVIVCRSSIQYIVQKYLRGEGVGARWRSVSYHRSRDTLIEAVARRCGDVDEVAAAKLAALPAWMEAAK